MFNEWPAVLWSCELVMGTRFTCGGIVVVYQGVSSVSGDSSVRACVRVVFPYTVFFFCSAMPAWQQRQNPLEVDSTDGALKRKSE